MIRYFLIAGVTFLVFLETYFRLPIAPQIVEYDFDEQLSARHRPGQGEVITFLGNYSVESPTITIDRDGFRGLAPLDAQTRAVVIGSSEVFGPGVGDDETVSAQLTSLNSGYRFHNLGVGGYGVDHHRIVLERAVAKHPIELAVVRVSMTDRYFVTLPPDQLALERTAKETREYYKSLVASASFTANRLTAQLASIRSQIPSPTDWFGKSAKNGKEGITPVLTRYSSAIQEMIRIADAADVKLLFYIPNGQADPRNTALCTALLTVLSSHAPHTLVEFTPEDYGIQGSETERSRQFAQRYTLGFDAHGNDARYRLLAELIDSQLTSPQGNSCSSS